MLPTIDLPVYTVKLPSSSKEVRLRPFIVKEEKLLLMALESGDLKDIIETVKQVMSNCLIDNDLNLDKLPFFDIDYLFITMRAKSVGEDISLRFICKNVVPDEEGKEKECGHRMNVSVNLSNIHINNLDIDKNIQLSPKISMKMKYPSYAIMKTIDSNENEMDKKIKYVMASIDKIVDGDSVYDVKDYTKEELQAFIEGLTEEQFGKLEYFVDNFPEFGILLKSKCGKCNFEHLKRYTDFSDFFQ